jgi:hypothetical protein
MAQRKFEHLLYRDVIVSRDCACVPLIARPFLVFQGPQKRSFIPVILFALNAAAPTVQNNLFTNGTIFYEPFGIEQVTQTAVTELIDMEEYPVSFGSPTITKTFWHSQRTR